jgi:hypothetical protein
MRAAAFCGPRRVRHFLAMRSASACGLPLRRSGQFFAAWAAAWLRPLPESAGVPLALGHGFGQAASAAALRLRIRRCLFGFFAEAAASTSCRAFFGLADGFQASFSLFGQQAFCP